MPTDSDLETPLMPSQAELITGVLEAAEAAPLTADELLAKLAEQVQGVPLIP